MEMSSDNLTKASPTCYHHFAYLRTMRTLALIAFLTLAASCEKEKPTPPTSGCQTMQEWTGLAPQPLTPSEGQATWMPIQWSWSEVGQAQNYHIEARTTTIVGDSVSLLTAFSLTSSPYTQITTLAPTYNGRQARWRIRAVSHDGDVSPWSPWVVFILQQ